MNDISARSECPEEESVRSVRFGGRGFRTLVPGLFFLLLLLAASLTNRPVTASPREEASFSFSAPEGMFFVGEKLEYEVSYSIFSLGKVRLEVIDSASRMGRVVYRAKAFMDSYAGVPFVNLHWVFYSEIDPRMYSHFFSGVDTKDSGNISYSDYSFDYAHGQVHVEKGIRQHQGSVRNGFDTISTEYQDGLSLFYYARANVHSNTEINVPTFVNEKKVNTFINFMNKKTSSEVDAVKYPVETIEFNGRADFVGIFGLTGGFTGWFSNDAAAIPIVAKMKVLIGSIRVELVEWNRPGWIPPPAAED